MLGAPAPRPIEPPATLGVLGGGQLGRMFAIAARSMGFGILAVDPDPSAPIADVAELVVAPYDDPTALDQLAARCAVVTTEFENAPAVSLERLGDRVRVAPGAAAVAIAQDRRAEKRAFETGGFPVGAWAEITGPASFAAAAARIPGPAILKTARLGYDGKGQRRISGPDELPGAFAASGGVPCVLEALVELRDELSVVVARGAGGEVRTFPVGCNTHVDGILDVTVVPARVPDAVVHEAGDIARRLAEQLGYVGVLAVELFVTDDGLLLNEMAPRPHNSGHWTLDGCSVSQFEQQVRAVCGLPLADPELLRPTAMLNVLGDSWRHGEPDWSEVLAVPGTHLHLYGKTQARPGRKMGHVNVTGTTAADVAARLDLVRGALRRGR